MANWVKAPPSYHARGILAYARMLTPQLLVWSRLAGYRGTFVSDPLDRSSMTLEAIAQEVVWDLARRRSINSRGPCALLFHRPVTLLVFLSSGISMSCQHPLRLRPARQPVCPAWKRRIFPAFQTQPNPWFLVFVHELQDRPTTVYRIQLQSGLPFILVQQKEDGSLPSILAATSPNITRCCPFSSPL